MDWEGLKKIAFGPLNLKPGEFWSLTPGEFQDLMEGYNWRREQEDNRFVQHAWVVASFQRAKRLPSLSKVLKTKNTEKKKRSKEELEQEWIALQADFDL